MIEVVTIDREAWGATKHAADVLYQLVRRGAVVDPGGISAANQYAALIRGVEPEVKRAADRSKPRTAKGRRRG
jgi:IS5 family transposase